MRCNVLVTGYFFNILFYDVTNLIPCDWLLSYRLRPIDVEFMKRMHNKVNIIPVIGKSDCLTPTEIKKLKERVSIL